MEIFISNFQSTLFDRYTKFQSFNSILESILMVLFRYISKEVKYGGSQLLVGYIFSASNLVFE